MKYKFLNQSSKTMGDVNSAPLPTQEEQTQLAVDKNMILKIWSSMEVERNVLDKLERWR